MLLDLIKKLIHERKITQALELSDYMIALVKDSKDTTALEKPLDVIRAGLRMITGLHEEDTDRENEKMIGSVHVI